MTSTMKKLKVIVGKRREGRMRRCSSTKVKKILKNFVP
jgi:hypothetical protein